MLSDKLAEAYAFYFEIVKMWGFLGILAMLVKLSLMFRTPNGGFQYRTKQIPERS
jgi:hypothetical protein